MCDNGPLLCRLTELVREIDGGCCPASCPPCQPCCPPVEPNIPFATCCMVCPPPCLAPTAPNPVKPLQLPCPNGNNKPQMSQEEAERIRYANFYNNYNFDYHQSSSCNGGDPRKERCSGVTVSGTSPCCEDYQKKPTRIVDKGCPTGFKPCSMKMTPPPGCHPCGVWCAEIQPCPPKYKSKKVSKYVPGPCRRPNCKHWKPKGGPCLYDKPCKASCFDHPPGIKASSG